MGILTCCTVVTPYYLLFGCLAHNLIVYDAKTKAVHTHVGWGVVVKGTPRNLVEDSLQKRESLHVAVVVHGDLSRRRDIEVVYLVVVANICCSGLVCNVHRMVYWKVPDWEGLELGIAALSTSLEVVVHLGKTGCKLAASRTWSGHYNNGLVSWDVRVCTIAFVAYDHVHVLRVAHYLLVEVDEHSTALEHIRKGGHAGFSMVARYNDFVGLYAPSGEVVYHLEDISIVGNTKVRPHLTMLYIAGMDAYYYIKLVFEGMKHLHLIVYIKAGKHPCGMVVEKQLASAFDIQLAIHFLHPLKDVLVLLPQIPVIVKTYLPHTMDSFKPFTTSSQHSARAISKAKSNAHPGPAAVTTFPSRTQDAPFSKPISLSPVSMPG